MSRLFALVKGLGGRSVFGAALAVMAAAVAMSPSLSCGFVNWDDPQYVLSDPLVRELSWDNVRSAFFRDVMGNYHPLTTLSLALDRRLSDGPWAHHFTNLLLHLLNTALVFIFCRALAGRQGAAFGAALIFGVHPLHVESVAWITERKDVLYAFFYLCALLAYLRYVRDGAHPRRWLAATMALFILSLLSKVQAVSLPLVLLLLDWYERRDLGQRCWLEKAPFFAGSLVFGWLAMHFAAQAEAFQYAAVFSGADRVFLASYAYVIYLCKFFFPMPLSCLYPYPEKYQGVFPPDFYVGLPVLLLSLGVVWRLRVDREAVFAVLFYTATIAGTLQLFPVGHAFLADRFTYVPLLGLGYLAAAAIGRMWTVLPRAHRVIAILCVIAVLSLVSVSRQRCLVWKNGETLWSDVLRTFPASHEAYLYRGDHFRMARNVPKALEDYARSEEIAPDFPKIYANRGSLWQDLGRNEPALQDYEKSLQLKPDQPQVLANRANLFAQMGKFEWAERDYGQALVMRPDDADIFYNRGVMFLQKGDGPKALADLEACLRLDPAHAPARYGRGVALNALGKAVEAREDLLKAQQLGYPVDERLLGQRTP